MAQPSWVTGSGSLGTIPEGKFYRASLEAYDPDFPSDSSKVKYIKVSGALPRGMQVNSSGIIEGTPVASVQGIPLAVSENVTSKFSIRVFTEKVLDGSIVQDRLRDRTFTITVTGQDAPEFITNSGELGKYFDGQLVNKQIEFTDTDPSDTAVVSIVSGELPPGITINESGLIYGYIEPAKDITIATAGWENEAWDSRPLQFNTGTISKSYQFTLRITDGVDYNLRTFSIYVGIATADSTAYTVDTDLMYADTVTRAPFINQYVKDLGTFLHDNFFIHRFEGVDYNGDILNYAEGVFDTVDTTFKTADTNAIRADYTTSIPEGLELDVDTGYLHGMLTNIGLTEKEYNFTVLVFKKDNQLVSNTFSFTMKVVGDVDTGVNWNTDKELGLINNGSISTLTVSATANTGTSLQYRLKQGGLYNKLPQGLQLLGSGNIVGRVDYQMFGIIDYNITADNNTTIDTSLITTDTNGIKTITIDGGKTSFDSEFMFTVEAYSSDNHISTFRTFTINVNKQYNLPLHRLRIDALLPQKSRALLDTLLENQDIIKDELLYRSDDPYFGVAKDVSYTHAYGLSPETLISYTEALDFNHFDKQLTLGKIETAQALDDNGKLIYEVVYSKIIDDIDGVPLSVTSNIGDVYPNSLDNMRNRVINKVGQISSVLPTWMLSTQKNGNVLGFTHAWVIAYTLPGQSEIIAYNINTIFGTQLNKIDFNADRYTLDAQFTRNWDAEDQRWYTTLETTFDIYPHNTVADTTNTTTDTSLISVDLFNTPTIETTFDKGSCVFIAVRGNTTDITNKTSDNIYITTDNGFKDTNTYITTDKFDKYLLFPNIDIINTK